VIGDSLGHGTQLQTPEGFQATVVEVGPAVKAAGFEPWVTVAIEFGRDIAAPAVTTLITTWLWQHFHDKAKGMTVQAVPPPEEDVVLDEQGFPAIRVRPHRAIDRAVIEFDDEGHVQRLLLEHIEKAAARKPRKR
jgi:hypothetical protein